MQIGWKKVLNINYNWLSFLSNDIIFVMKQKEKSLPQMGSNTFCRSFLALD
jgi:hypothetical protein